ncbi:MAG: Ref family protein [Proteobacteria bacterium]|nr:Ref family protein [Pseudomonadota bacterium]
MNVAQYKNRVAEIGCIICGCPACLHHPRFCIGMSQRSSDWLVIPLCPAHHQTGGFGVAIHANKVAFEGNFGTEQELLAKVIQNVAK